VARAAGEQVAEARGGRDGATAIGPPLLVVAAGAASLVASVLLLAVGGGAGAHLLGYLTGAIVPILVIGIARRVDLDRRTQPSYRPSGLFPLAMLVLGVGAVVTAGLHIWPLATEWAS